MNSYVGRPENIYNELFKTRKLRPISSLDLRDFGLQKDFLKHVEILEQLRTEPPNIVIAQPTQDVSLLINFVEKRKLKKGLNYVMGLGVYQQVHYDSVKGKRVLRPSKVKFKSFYKPYMGQDLTDKSLLVFRTGGIGDLLFIQPNLYFLKEKYPSCKIIFACAEQYQPMVKNWSCVDEVISLPFEFSYLRETDYHCLFEGVIERCKEATRVNAYRLFTRWMGLNLPENLLIPSQKPVEEIKEKVEESLFQRGLRENEFILVQVRSSTYIRTPSSDFWFKLLTQLIDKGQKIALIDHERFKDTFDAFINRFDKKDMIYNLCDLSPSLDYTIAITSLCKGVVGADSALLHLAASLNKKCFGIYGPFLGELRLATYPSAKWVNAQRHCAPCFLHQVAPCPHHINKISPCFENIDISKTSQEIVDFMG